MHVLVTGATGFLGAALVRRLLAERTDVRVLARSSASARDLVDRGATLAVGDVADGAVMRDALRGVDVVYHLAGRLLVPGIPEAVYRRTHVEGTRTLVACCIEQSGIQRIVHCSTTGVLGVTGDRPADESAAAAPTNVYEQTKWEAELLVRQAVQRGFPAVIARPGLVYGPGDLHLVGLFQSIQRRLFRPIGSRPVFLHPIYIDDMVEALVRCGQNPAAVGECFHVAGQEPATIASLAATIADALGVSRPGATIPLPVARAVALAADLLPSGLRHLAPLTRSRVDFLTHSRVYDVTRAQRLLGFEATTGLSTGIARSVAWYRRNGYLKVPIKTGVSARSAR